MQTGLTEILPQSFPPVGILGTLQPRAGGPKMPEHFDSEKDFTQLILRDPVIAVQPFHGTTISRGQDATKTNDPLC
jgi:hypothetical protein